MSPIDFDIKLLRRIKELKSILRAYPEYISQHSYAVRGDRYDIPYNLILTSFKFQVVKHRRFMEIAKIGIEDKDMIKNSMDSQYSLRLWAKARLVDARTTRKRLKILEEL